MPYSYNKNVYIANNLSLYSSIYGEYVKRIRNTPSFTMQEAVFRNPKDGFLYGVWPLISPKDYFY